jgi:glycosyltransferase involved in cell wall biosynthesis
MNILLVSYMRMNAPSGVRVHYLTLADQLRQRGHQVDIVTPASLTGWRQTLLAVLRHTLWRSGASARSIATELVHFLAIQWSIDTSKPYDVVNAQDLGSGAAARRALGSRVPVVVTGHFNDHPAADEQRRRNLQGPAARTIQRWYKYLLSQTDYFIGVSNFGLRVIQPALPAHTECCTIHNGVDFARLRADRSIAKLRQRYAGRRVILNIGQLESRKNQALLIEAARELRQQRNDFVVGLVGKGEDHARLQQLIDEYNLKDCVVLLGYHDNVLPLLRCADLYVHVATHETFGLVLVEAAAAGVPVVALAVGGVPEVLHGTPEALLPTTVSPVGLARHIHAWLNSPTALHNLRIQQDTYAQAHFDVPRMVDDTLAFYQHARRHFYHQAPTVRLLPVSSFNPEPEYELQRLA